MSDSLLILPVNLIKQHTSGTSLVVPWLRICLSMSGGRSSIPDQGTKIPHAVQFGQTLKKENQIQTGISRAG